MASALFRCARLAFNTSRHGVKTVVNGPLAQVRAFSVSKPSFADRLYTEDHEWVVLNGNVGRIGLSDHAQDALGDIVYVELPEVDDTFEQGDTVGVVESVKAVSDIFSPLTGTIKARNEDVIETPGTINKDCYDKGWLFEVEMSSPEEAEKLMDEEAYKQFLEKE